MAGLNTNDFYLVGFSNGSLLRCKLEIAIRLCKKGDYFICFPFVGWGGSTSLEPGENRAIEPYRMKITSGIDALRVRVTMEADWCYL